MRKLFATKDEKYFIKLTALHAHDPTYILRRIYQKDTLIQKINYGDFMTLSPVHSQISTHNTASAHSDRLDFSNISSINVRDILAPLEAKTNCRLVIKSLSEILSRHDDESSPRFQQLIGDFFIFQMPVLQQFNEESEKYADEGYGKQGSRMAFHRPHSIACDFKQALRDPERNAFSLVLNEVTGEILGSISLLQCDNGLPELSNFYLSKDLRRDGGSQKIGIGKYLFAQMLSFAQKMNHDEVFLTSRRKGGFEKALNLFAQFGFKEVTKPEEINRLVRPEYQSVRTIAMLLSNLNENY